MVDVSVGDTYSYNLFPTTIGKVWDRGVDTKLVLIRKLKTHINDKHLILILKTHTVESYLLSPSKRDDSKCFFCERFRTLLWNMEIFFESLLWGEKWIRPFRTKTIFEKKRVTWSEVWIDSFSRVEKFAKGARIFPMGFVIGTFLKIRFILHKNIFFGKG